MSSSLLFFFWLSFIQNTFSGLLNVSTTQRSYSTIENNRSQYFIYIYIKICKKKEKLKKLKSTENNETFTKKNFKINLVTLLVWFLKTNFFRTKKKQKKNFFLLESESNLSCALMGFKVIFNLLFSRGSNLRNVLLEICRTWCGWR